MDARQFFYGIIKPRLVDMAIQGTLPLDLNELSFEDFEPVPEPELEPKVFLTLKQTAELKAKEWNPIPDCCWVSILPEDDCWDEVSTVVGSNPNEPVEELRLCIIGFQEII